MAHYPPPNNPLVCKVALIMARDARQIVNTFHVARAAGWDLASMDVLAQAVLAWFNATYKTCLPNTYSLNQIQVRKQNPVLPLALDVPVSPAVVGTRPGVAEAGNVTSTMSLRAGLAGKAFRGRLYTAGLAEADVTSGDLLTSPIVSLLAITIGNLVFGALPAGDLLCIFHRPGLVPKPLDNLYTVVNTYVIENIIDSQRRRLPGRGR